MSCELPVCTGRAALGGKRRVAAASAACLLGAALFLSALLLSPANRGFTLPRCWLRGGGSPLPPQVAASEGPPVEVVIAHYNHALNWTGPFVASLGDPDARLTVYSKGPSAPAGAIPLPNLGREAHTYLYHIVERYHSLADVTIFLMDSSSMHPKDQRLRDVQANWRRAYGPQGMMCGLLYYNVPDPHFQIDSWLGSTDSEQASGESTGERVLHGKPLAHASPRPFGAWFAEFVGGPFPQAWCVNVQLAVHRHNVLLRPRAFYRALLDQVSVAADTEAGHFLERSWASIFGHPEALSCGGRP